MIPSVPKKTFIVIHQARAKMVMPSGSGNKPNIIQNNFIERRHTGPYSV